jgi:hypothetical protein
MMQGYSIPNSSYRCACVYMTPADRPGRHQERNLSDQSKGLCLSKFPHVCLTLGLHMLYMLYAVASGLVDICMQHIPIEA